MTLLRAILYFALLMITILLYGAAILVPYKFVSARYVDRMVQRWSQTNAWLQKVICGLDVQVTGQEHLAAAPCILMVKHQSAWETISLHHHLPKQQAWVLKKELLHIPVLGWVLRVGSFIPIDRHAGRRAILDLIQSGGDALNAGRSVLIFPEGTRTAPGMRQKYNVGGAMLAQKTGYPVVPIAHNAGVYWARRGLKKYPGTIQVRIGSPITTTDKSTKEILALTEDWIENTMQTLPTQRLT
ncbi:MAG: lysophospholipid acyltransferase family protein [Pseudomonadota bacterium]